jgi:hypothetical protein
MTLGRAQYNTILLRHVFLFSSRHFQKQFHSMKEPMLKCFRRKKCRKNWRFVSNYRDALLQKQDHNVGF